MNTPSPDDKCQDSDSDHLDERSPRQESPDLYVDSAGATTPEERLAMVWPLTIKAWALRGVDIANTPMARDVVKVIRRNPSQSG
jgi:hypothetical protein